MTVTASSFIPVESSPTDKNDLWRPSALFEHNWSSPCSVDSLWYTGIENSRSVSEVRHAWADKPVRAVGAVLQSRGRDSMRIARGLMMRSADARSLWPVYPDQVDLTGIIECGTNPIYGGDFKYKRFFVGGRIESIPDQHADLHEAPDLHIRNIIAVGDSWIQLGGDLGETCNGPEVEQSGNDSSTSTSDITISSITVTDGTNDRFVIFVAAEQEAGDSNLTFAWGLSSSFIFQAVQSPTENIRLYAVGVVPAGAGTDDLTIDWPGGHAAGRDMAVSWSVITKLNTADMENDNTGNFNVRILTGEEATLASVAAVDAGALRIFGCGLLDIGTVAFSNYRSGTKSLETNVAQDTKVTTSYNTSTKVGEVFTFGVDVTHSAAGLKNIPVAMIELNPENNDFASGDEKGRMFPAIECDLTLKNSIEALTDEHSGFSPDLDETAGVMTLDPTTTPATNPAEFSTFNGDPIFHIGPNWINMQKVSFDRLGKNKQLGIGKVADVFGTRARVPWEMSFTRLDRAEAWQIMSFFDSRAGSAHPFWLASPTTEYTLVAYRPGGTATGGIKTVVTRGFGNGTFSGAIRLVVTRGYVSGLATDQLQVEAAGPVFDWNFHPYIGIVEKDGTVHIRQISSVARLGGRDTITATTDFPDIPITDIERVCIAHQVRFNTDVLHEEWLTTQHMTCSLSFMELINEKTVSVTVDNPNLGGSGDNWNDDGGSPCETQCAGTVCTVCMDDECTLIMEWWNYQTFCPDGCLTQCDVIEQGAVPLAPISCISNVMRWEGSGGSFAELDTDTGLWTYGLPAGANSGVATLGICACTGDDTRTTQSCSIYLEEATCPPDTGVFVNTVSIRGASSGGLCLQDT